MNFSKIMSLKYLYLPETITSNNFYNFAVKVPTLRIIDVPRFYDTSSALDNFLSKRQVNKVGGGSNEYIKVEPAVSEASKENSTSSKSNPSTNTFEEELKEFEDEMNLYHHTVPTKLMMIYLHFYLNFGIHS